METITLVLGEIIVLVRIIIPSSDHCAPSYASAHAYRETYPAELLCLKITREVLSRVLPITKEFSVFIFSVIILLDDYIHNTSEPSIFHFEFSTASFLYGDANCGISVGIKRRSNFYRHFFFWKMFNSQLVYFIR